ncbi:hypothetical protein NEHOM01_1512, partial [Nematocida homosporus]|uniref:uncharacterized protein n=1 Tax=Nematocida homosporus TaxID=1912981 RepID=UPI002220E077
MSYLEIVRGVNRNRLYRGQAIRNRIVVVLYSLLVVLGSVRGGCGDGMCDSKVGGVSDVDVQEITAPVGWEKSPKMTEDLKALGFLFRHEESIVYVKKHMTEEVTVPVSDSTVALTSTNSTERIDQPMVLWPEPELKFTMPKTSEVDKLQKVLKALKDIVVIKAEKAVFVYQLEYLGRCEDKLKAISRVINMLECEELELRIEEYDIERYSHWASEVEPSLTELEETIKFAASNSKHNLTINVCCLNPSRVDLSPLNMSLRNLASKPALIVTIMQKLNNLLTYSESENLSRDLSEVLASTNIDCTALHNQEIQCQKIVIHPNCVLTLTGLENATTNIHSEIVLELRWDILLYLIRRNNPIINVHTIIALSPASTKELFQHLLQEQPFSTPRILATKIATKTNIKGCWCLENTYNQYYNPEVYAKYGISVDESTIEYTKRQDGLLDTLKVLEKNLYVDCKKSIEHVIANGIKCPAEDCSNNKLELQEPVEINLESLYDDGNSEFNNYDIDIGIDPNILFCQNIHYTDININGCDDYKASEACQTLLSPFVNITARTLRISNIYCCTVYTFDLSMIEGDDALPEICRRRLDLKTLILDNVDGSLVYWILNNYTFADSMEVYILNQDYSNLNITQILSHPTYRKISKLVLNDFIGLDEVRLYEEYKKEGRLTELSLFNYIEAMKAENKTTTDLGLNKLMLQLEGVDCNKYAEILTEFKNIGIQCEEVPFAVIVDRQIANCNSYIRAATYAVLRNSNKSFDKELVLRNINLQDLEADLASRCT